MIPIDEVCIFDVVTHVAATGAVSDADSAPTFDVFEEDTDTPILAAQTMTKRTSKTGNYRGSFTASAANGFEAGKWYSVVVSATVSSIAAKCVAKHFRVAPVESQAGVPKTDLAYLEGTAPSTHASGMFPSDVRDFGGSAGTFASGRPEVNTTHLAGSAVDQSGGILNVNVKQISTDATAADNAELFFDGTGYAGTNNVIPTVTTLTNAPSDSSGITTLLSRLSALRAGYLDNLSAGAVALETSLQALITTIGASAAGVASAVWGAATRLLTAGTNIVLAKGTGVTGFNDLSAAQVNTEADTALADYDGPTNAELATALASADDATLAAIAALSIPTAIQNADALLNRDMATGTDSGSSTVRTVRQALRFLRNKWSISGGVITVTKENDSDTSWTGAVGTTSGDPVTSIDPTGP